MQLWLVVLGCFAVLGVIAFAKAVRLEVEARAAGEPSGTWVTAFGLAVGPAVLSGVCARGLPLSLEIHAFGRRFPVKRQPRSRAPRGSPPSPSSGAARGVAHVLARLEHLLGLPAGLDTVLRLLRWVELERLSLDAAYGFRDIALTGRVAGALYALSGALPEQVVFRQRPSWDGAERWELNAAGCLSVYPGLVLLTALWYMLRTRVKRSSWGGPTPRKALER